MKFSKKICVQMAERLGVNLDVVGVDQWCRGMNVELEHGRRNEFTNVTNNDPFVTAHIALAHLLEFPNYYDGLQAMETVLDEQWKGKKKPNVLF